MERKEFFEWINKCKCDYVYEKDDYGEINITFYPNEETKEQN